MRRGTTPTVRLHVKNYTFPNCQIIFTIRQLKDDVSPYPQEIDNYRRPIFPILIQKTGDDVRVVADEQGGAYVSCKLTQKDTLKLVTGKAKVQIRWVYADGSSNSSDIKEFFVEPILTDGELLYGAQDQKQEQQ